MSINGDLWKSTTKSIFSGVMIYSLGGIVISVLGIISAIAAGASLAGGSVGGAVGAAAVMGTLTVLIGIAMIVGYIMYFMGIGKFRDIVDEADKPTIQKLYTAIIIGIAGTVIGLIPILGFLGKIAEIIAFVLMFLAYMQLKDSKTFPELACKGANKLYWAMILSVGGKIIAWIPIIGFIGQLILLVGFVMVFLGWSDIKNAEPNTEAKVIEDAKVID